MGPKRHHYVPQFYLNYFAAQPKKGGKAVVWVYDKEGGLPRPQRPLNTAVVGHLYTVETPEGKKDVTPERIFAHLEAVAKPVMDRWQSREARVQPGERPVIAEFLALMHLRVPRSIEFVSEMGVALAVASLDELARSPERLKEIWDQFSKERQVPLELTFEDARAALVNVEERVKISMNRKVAMAFSLLQASEIYPLLLTMNWCLCRAPRDAFFITSDSPVNVFVRRGAMAGFGAGFALKTVEVALPISPEVCLYLDRRTTQARRSVGEAFVREINRRCACMAERFVISPYNSRRVQDLVTEFAYTRQLPKTDRKALMELYRARRERRIVAPGGMRPREQPGEGLPETIPDVDDH